MYSLGILGGMGSKATARMFDIIVENTAASTDQEHLNIVVLNKAIIPDRTSNLLKDKKSVLLPYFIDAVKDFECLSVKNIVIPCNTSHLLYTDLQNNTNLTIINMVQETLHYISLSKLSKRVCILGTLGTVNLRLFDAFNIYGLEIFYPPKVICERIQRIIYQIKNTQANNMSQMVEEIAIIMEELQNNTTENIVFVLGCTELSLLDKTQLERFAYIDPMEITSLVAILKSGGALQNNKLPYEYEAINRIANM